MRPRSLSSLALALALLCCGSQAFALDALLPVPWVPAAPGIPHDTYNGRATTFKAVATGVTVGPVRFLWSYGDGANSGVLEANRVLNNEYADLSASYAFPVQATDRLFVATVWACDVAVSGAACNPLGGVSAQYPVKVWAATTRQVRVNAAIDDGLWFLHRNMTRGAGAAAVRTASVTEGNAYAATSMTVQAFAVQGHNLSLPAELAARDPYLTDVVQGLNFLTAGLTSTAMPVANSHGQNADSNGNGFALVQANNSYIDGMLMMTLASLGDPEFRARTGPANTVLNRPLVDLVQDLADWFVWAQTDTALGVIDGKNQYRGGWRYTANSMGEGSTNQWPILGLDAGRTNFRNPANPLESLITIPTWAIEDQENWLDYSQAEGGDPEGGFGYTQPTEYTNVAKTGAGLAAGAFIGLAADSNLPPGYQAGHGASMLRAWSYLKAKWTRPSNGWSAYHWGGLYAMYAVKKGAYAFKPDAVTCVSNQAAHLLLPHDACVAAGGHPWEAQYDDYLTRTGNCLTGPAGTVQGIVCPGQLADGSWLDRDEPQTGYWNNTRRFTTAMAVLILTPQVFEVGPVALAAANPTLANPGDLITFDHSRSYHPGAPRNQVIRYFWDWDNGDGLWWQDNPQLPGEDGLVPAGCTVDAGNCLGAVIECTDDDHETCKAVKPTHRYFDVLAAGETREHIVTLKVEDDHQEPLSDLDDESVRIRISRSNHPPVAICDPSPPLNPGDPNYEVSQGHSVTLDGNTSYDPDATQPPEAICVGMGPDHIVIYQWDLNNDGTFETAGPSPTFTPPAGAPVDQLFPIRLRVVDDGTWASCNEGSVAGLAGEAICLIRIVPNQPPEAVALPDGAVYECTSYRGAWVQLDGTLSRDPEGDPLGFSWAPAADLTGADTARPSGTFPLGGPYWHTLTVTDRLGATASDPASFSVADRVAPTVTCTSASAECVGPDGTPVAVTASAWDVCDREPSMVNDARPSYPVGRTTVTWTATDDSQNRRTCLSRVTVLDTLPPTVTCQGGEAECAGPLTEVAVQGAARDQCDGELPAQGAPLGPYPLGETPVTFQAVDAAGNPATCRTDARVVDTLAPVLTCEDGAAECTSYDGAAVSLSATALDRCMGELDATGPTLPVYPLGTTAVTFGADDGNGNQGRCEARATVFDTTPPTLNCPAEQLLECTSPAGASTELAAQATDLCDPVVDVTGDWLGTQFPLGSTEVMFVATDDSDNSTYCHTAVTVQDTTPPVVSCQDELAECQSPAGTPVQLQASAVDVCDETLPLTSDAQSVYGLGETLVTWHTTDDAGNPGACTATVTIEDTLAPQVTCQPAGAECVGPLTPVALTASATDLCFGPLDPIVSNPGPFPLGETPATWTAEDGVGLVGTCSTVATVTDTTPPVVTVLGPDPARLECQSPWVDPGAVAVDLCEGELPVAVAGLVHPDQVGGYPLTYTAVDSSGNQGQADREVLVQDTLPPRVECAPAQAECVGPLTPVPLVATAADICSGPLAPVAVPVGPYPLGETLVTWTATDGVGLQDTCTTLATVVDTTPPVVTVQGPDPATLECGEPWIDPGAVALDVCEGELPVTVDGVVESSIPGDYGLTYTAVDTSGNRGQAERDVVVLPLFGADALIWHQMIPGPGLSDESDPSHVTDGDPSNDTWFPFQQNRAIPVQVHVLDKWGNEITAQPTTVAHVAVFADLGCDGQIEAGDQQLAIEPNGIGGPDGLMILVGGQGHTHRKYNLSTKRWPNTTDCFIIQVTGQSTGDCQDEQREYVLFRRK